MKDKQVNLRASRSDKELLSKAAHILSMSTGQKENISKTIFAALKIFIVKNNKIQ